MVYLRAGDLVYEQGAKKIMQVNQFKQDGNLLYCKGCYYERVGSR